MSGWSPPCVPGRTQTIHSWCLGCSDGPVSYTHLDVYKRQLFNCPYPALLAVIIGVTNVIPFFGPFIGAIPCALLILIISPIQCVYFVIFILVLQQFDGNILGPKILGDSTGLASFWVLFSILLFGGLFGFAGMVLGVPVFAMRCV